jgi:RNA polymerase sigma factor (sigma-70 family)
MAAKRCNARAPIGEEESMSDSIGTDAEAFARFYRTHVEDVERFVARRVSDPWLAADLTADVFLAVIESAARYSPDRGRPLAWLYGIARNVVADAQRRDARERHATSRIRGSELVDDADLAALSARIDAEADSRALHAALARLPASERAVIELVAVDGLTPGEAARALGISQVAARVRLHRARRALQHGVTFARTELEEA